MKKSDPIFQYIELTRGKPWTYRLKIKNEVPVETWSNWIIHSGESYVETERQGPYPQNYIDWIEINPLQLYQAGRLMPVKEIDHTNEIIALLGKLKIEYSLHSKMIRIVL